MGDRAEMGASWLFGWLGWEPHPAMPAALLPSPSPVRATRRTGKWKAGGRGPRKMDKLLSSPVATLPERFAVLQSVSPTGLTSWTAIAWALLTKQPLAKFVGLFGCGRNACRKRSRTLLVMC